MPRESERFAAITARHAAETAPARWNQRPGGSCEIPGSTHHFRRAIDGLKVDREGNVYVSGRANRPLSHPPGHRRHTFLRCWV